MLAGQSGHDSHALIRNNSTAGDYSSPHELSCSSGRRALGGFSFLELEKVESPGRQIKIEAVASEAVAIALEASIAKQVDKGELSSTQPAHIQRHVALSLRWPVVNGSEQAAVPLFPGEHDELVPGRVPRPGGATTPESPVAIMDFGSL